MTQYRKVLAVALFSFGAIVLTGALVRLTSSGLGCEDWPKCTEDKVVPEWAFHSWVEFGNRLFSGLIGVGAVALVWATRRVRLRNLVPWAWGVLGLTAAQVIVGAITVKTELNPYSVTIHFLLSMAILWILLVMWVRTSERPDTGNIPRQLRLGVLALGVWSTAVLATGTVLTGTGPNGGDSRADRLSLDITWVARVHSGTVWVLLAATILVAVRAQRQMGADHPLVRKLRLMLVLVCAQGAIGYLQYGLGVPAGLVFIHVTGSVVIWCTLVWLGLVFNYESSNVSEVSIDHGN